jgi:hypothetical protein
MTPWPAGLRRGWHRDLHTLRMDKNPYRDEEVEEPSAYWRRRAVTLAAGLGVLGLLAWALSGGGGKPGTPRTSASGSMSAAAYPGVSAPAVTTSPGASPSASPSASPGASAGADAAVPGLGSGTSGLPSAASSAHSAARKPAAGTTSAAAGPGGSDGPCPASAIVLSLFASQSSYASGQDPTFSLDTVSTAAGRCTFDVSPAQLHMVVMSAGRVIWDSADCARPGQTQTDRLTRGVPVQQSFAWNRAITLPGCVTLASAARPGTYTAQVRASGVASDVRTFRLAH